MRYNSYYDVTEEAGGLITLLNEFAGLIGSKDKVRAALLADGESVYDKVCPLFVIMGRYVFVFLTTDFYSFRSEERRVGKECSS